MAHHPVDASRATLGFLGCVFGAMAVGLLVDPAAMQAPHGLDFRRSSPSALAEIRAYYFGTSCLVSAMMLAGARGGVEARARGLLGGGALLGAFCFGRCWSYFADGPPDLAAAKLVWLSELLGSGWLLALWWLEAGRETAWGRRLAALARSEPLTTPGEALGNALCALAVFATWGPDDAAQLVARNVARYLLAYGGAFLVFYRLRVATRHKFDPSHDRPVLAAELRRWAGSVAVGTGYDLLLRLHPTAARLGLSTPSERAGLRELTGHDLALVLPLVVLLVDLHFYAVHRALHAPVLFRYIHSSHHESKSPNPISGLSFHPFEAALYFSAAPIAGLALVPLAGQAGLHRLHLALLKSLLDFNPIWGHAGVGGRFGGSFHHFLHHKVGAAKRCNFGGTWLFDGLLGTGYVVPRPAGSASPGSSTRAAPGRARGKPPGQRRASSPKSARAE